MRPNYKKLIDLYEHLDVPEANATLREAFGRDPESNALPTRQYKPADFDIPELFIHCFGYNAFDQCRKRGKEQGYLVHDVFEAAGATSTASFANISYQIVYSAIMDAYDLEEQVFSKVIPTRPSMFIGQEKVAGVTQQGDQDLVVPEGQEFPLVGVGQTWIHLPEALKRGRRVALTREAIFSMNSVGAGGALLDRCAAVGTWLGVNREKRAVDVVIDENAGAVNSPTGHRYRWRDTYLNTYGDNSGSHSFDNLAASNDLTAGDWTKLDAAEQLLNQMVDPDTGEPMMSDFNYLIVTKQLEKTALRILNNTEIRVSTPGFATTGAPTQVSVANPYAGKFQVLSSRLLYQRLNTKTHWFFGNLTKAFVYKEIFPRQVLEAPTNSMDEFKNDVVRQWRADEMGAYATVEPRFMIKNTP
jgi:hypothetical protein